MSPQHIPHPALVRQCFSPTYAKAREKFIAAARQARATLAHHVLDGLSGAEDETLAMDVALIGPADASAMVVLSSGVHGIEGFCGSGCQIALLQDELLLDLARERGVALLLVHAVNPHGFSFRRRVNEDGVDLNRNFIHFGKPTHNPAYAELHELLLPREWPPNASTEQAMARYIALHGEAAFLDAVSTGQSRFADGLFYAGARPSWSNHTLRSVIRQHAAPRERIAWIDVHTGLGRFGHGEKIHGGRPGDVENLRVSRTLWGADVVAAWEGASASRQVAGHAVGSVFEECPQAQCVGIALEYGARRMTCLDALRADHWLHRYPGAAAPAQREQIAQDMRDTFYADDDEWRGMVTAQCRTALLQACTGLPR